MTRFRPIVALLAVLVTAGAIYAATELVLMGGRVVVGDEVRREGDNYVVRLETGQAMVFPADLVEEVRLVGEDEPEPPPAPEPEVPTGLTYEEPRVLAGEEVRPPRAGEQTAAIGRPSRFQDDVIDPTWHPTTDWNMDPETQNNFAPSTWAEAPIDPTWHPTSAFDRDEDVLADGRSTWQKSIVDTTWKPTDGFAN